MDLLNLDSSPVKQAYQTEPVQDIYSSLNSIYGASSYEQKQVVQEEDYSTRNKGLLDMEEPSNNGVYSSQFY